MALLSSVLLLVLSKHEIASEDWGQGERARAKRGPERAKIAPSRLLTPYFSQTCRYSKTLIKPMRF